MEIETKQKVEQAEARIRRLEEERPPALQGDERIIYNNHIRKAKNVIREAQGLEPKPLNLTDEEISTLVDTGLIDEKLKSMPHGAEKRRVQRRANEIILYQRFLESREKEQKKFIRDVQWKIDQLRLSSPDPIIRDDEGHIKTNPEFNRWVDQLISLEEKLRKKVRGLKAAGRDIAKERPDIEHLRLQVEALKAG